MSRIVFNAVRVAGGFEHFQIKASSLFEPFRFQQFSFFFQFLQAIFKFCLDIFYGPQNFLFRRYEMFGGEYFMPGNTRCFLGFNTECWRKQRNFSILSPKNSIRVINSPSGEEISRISPLTEKVPARRSISFLSYCRSANLSSNSFRL